MRKMNIFLNKKIQWMAFLGDSGGKEGGDMGPRIPAPQTRTANSQKESYRLSQNLKIGGLWWGAA